MPVGQMMEQVLEEGWVALWAVIVFTVAVSLLAEVLIHGEERPLLSKNKTATVSGLQPSQGQDWPHAYIEVSLVD